MAFLGVVLYFVSELFGFFPSQAAQVTRFAPLALGQGLPVAAGAGSALFLAGLIRALWRINPAAGRTRTGQAGLLAGMAGIAVRLVLEIAVLASLTHFSAAPLAAIARVSTAMDIAGTGWAFFALFLLCVGLICGTRLFLEDRPLSVERSGLDEGTPLLDPDQAQTVCGLGDLLNDL